MRICVLTLICSYEGAEKEYNAQDIGLGKAFADLGNITTIIRLEKRSTKQYREELNDKLSLIHYKVKSIGGNSINVCKFIPVDSEVVVCFSDIQISFLELYRHCKKNNIKLIPYIGVIESHSTNPIIRKIMNIWARLIISKYRSMKVCAKTIDVKEKLSIYGVNNAFLVPVCLDKDKLMQNFSTISTESLRKEIIPSYKENVKTILFVGKLVEEKRPQEALQIFKNLYSKDELFRLIIIGKGEKMDSLTSYIHNNGLSKVVKIYQRIQNIDMWKYYLSADCLINLNRKEIFGMCILEAMYYECPVVAYAAPGPQMIINDGINGYLFNDNDECIDKIAYSMKKGRLKAAKQNILDNYMWRKSAMKILSILSK